MMREKHRYILVESTASMEGMENKLYNQLFYAIGSAEYSKVNPKIISAKGNSVLIRCSLAGFGKLVLALTFIKSIDKNPIAFYTIKASGTIRALLAGSKNSKALSPAA
ncbi:MAG: Rpp14/Pop5 family protein [Candidatus Micrarchaeia archaeon]